MSIKCPRCGGPMLPKVDLLTTDHASRVCFRCGFAFTPVRFTLEEAKRLMERIARGHRELLAEEK